MSQSNGAAIGVDAFGIVRQALTLFSGQFDAAGIKRVGEHTAALAAKVARELYGKRPRQ